MKNMKVKPISYYITEMHVQSNNNISAANNYMLAFIGFKPPIAGNN